MKAFSLCALALSLLIATACGTQANRVGTSVGNPVVPKSNIVPAFEDAIPETAITSQASTSASDLSTQALVLAETADNGPKGPSQEWDAVFVEGGVNDARVQRTNLEGFGAQVAQALDRAGISAVTSTSQSVDVGSYNLITTSAAWQVEVMADAQNDAYVRMYFKNQATNLIQGTYLFTADAAGTPVRGIFAYVDPTLLSATAGEGKRLVALAFDFSDPSDNLLVMRVDQYHLEADYFYTYHVHQECDDSGRCLGEYLDIPSEEPERDFDHNLRLSWDEGSDAVCIAYVTYTDAIQLGTTDSFTGPETPDPAAVTTGTCTLTTPFWGGHLYSQDDLPLRYSETDPVGGTALDYYIDGASKQGWDTLTASLIDSWLDASDF